MTHLPNGDWDHRPAVDRLLAVGGRNRAKDVARIVLASGKVVTRRVDVVRLLPEPPRSLP